MKATHKDAGLMSQNAFSGNGRLLTPRARISPIDKEPESHLETSWADRALARLDHLSSDFERVANRAIFCLSITS